MTPEQTLDWLAQQHWDQCREDRPIQDWIRKMKSQLPAQPEQEPVACIGYWNQKTGAFYKPDQLASAHQKMIEEGILRRCYIVSPQRTWVGLMRGVRVEGDSVVISVKGGNEAARELCGALIEEMSQ